MDYGAMWERLRNEMLHLQEKNVTTLAPAIALGYMDFIQDEVSLRNLVNSPKEAESETDASREAEKDVKDKKITLKTDINWIDTVLVREWPTKSGHLLLLRTPETHTVMDPDGNGWIFNNEPDALKLYEAKVKEAESETDASREAK